jgi:hypothetical protein
MFISYKRGEPQRQLQKALFPISILDRVHTSTHASFGFITGGFYVCDAAPPGPCLPQLSLLEPTRNLAPA